MGEQLLAGLRKCSVQPDVLDLCKTQERYRTSCIALIDYIPDPTPCPIHKMPRGRICSKTVSFILYLVQYFLRKKRRAVSVARSYPHDAEWPGDRLETDIPADKLGNLLGEYARPFTSAEASVEGGPHMNKVCTRRVGG